MGASLFNVPPDCVNSDNGLLFNDGLDNFRGYTIPVEEIRQKISPQLIPETVTVADSIEEEKEESYMDVFDYD